MLITVDFFLVAYRVPPVLAARYGVVESKVERVQIGASSQARDPFVHL